MHGAIRRFHQFECLLYFSLLLFRRQIHSVDCFKAGILGLSLFRLLVKLSKLLGRLQETEALQNSFELVKRDLILSLGPFELVLLWFACICNDACPFLFEARPEQAFVCQTVS